MILTWVCSYLLAVALVEWRAGGRIRNARSYVYLLALAPLLILPLVTYASTTTLVWLLGGRPCPFGNAPAYARRQKGCRGD